MDKPVLKVGVSAVIFNNKNEILMMKRKGSHGDGTWAFPGGAMELGEGIVEAMRREVAEEIGVTVTDEVFLAVYNLLDYMPKHYVGISFVVTDWSGEPKILEPAKCSEIGWFSMRNLPSPRFAPIDKYLLQAYESLTYDFTVTHRKVLYEG